MSPLSWICLVPRRPAGPASLEPPAGRQHEDSRTAPHAFTLWSHAVSQSRDKKTAPAARQQKWLPVIDTDRCIGCERCVNACEHGCLEMIWSFSTLMRPQVCGGEGRCVEACPEQIIQMSWVTIQGDVELSQSRAEIH